MHKLSTLGIAEMQMVLWTAVLLMSEEDKLLSEEDKLLSEEDKLFQ